MSKLSIQSALITAVAIAEFAVGRSWPATPADDLFALAASFFHVVFEKEPFRHDGELVKDRGLNWAETNREEYATLGAILGPMARNVSGRISASLNTRD